MSTMLRPLLLATCLSLIGCESDSGPKPRGHAEASNTPSAATTTTARAAPSASAASEPLKTSKPKAYAFTAEDAIGTLPEGVGIAVGEKAPDFTLTGKAGEKVALGDLLKKGEVLLTFYRGGW